MIFLPRAIAPSASPADWVTSASITSPVPGWRAPNWPPVATTTGIRQRRQGPTTGRHQAPSCTTSPLRQRRTRSTSPIGRAHSRAAH